MHLAQITMVVSLVHVITGILVTELCVMMLTNVLLTLTTVAITHHAQILMALLHALVLMVLLVTVLSVMTLTNVLLALMIVIFPALFVQITLADITAIVSMDSFYETMNVLTLMNVQPTKLIVMSLQLVPTLLVDMNVPACQVTMAMVLRVKIIMNVLMTLIHVTIRVTA